MNMVIPMLDGYDSRDISSLRRLLEGFKALDAEKREELLAIMRILNGRQK